MQIIEQPGWLIFKEMHAGCCHWGEWRIPDRRLGRGPHGRQHYPCNFVHQAPTYLRYLQIYYPLPAVYQKELVVFVPVSRSIHSS
jgi:hypothetical protein